MTDNAYRAGSLWPGGPRGTWDNGRLRLGVFPAEPLNQTSGDWRDYERRLRKAVKPPAPPPLELQRWLDLVPAWIAERQIKWELRRRIVRAHDAGATYAEIGRKLGFTGHYMKLLADSGRKWPVSPVEKWMSL